MHIVDKILRSINYTLRNHYNIYVPIEDWELFKTPLTNINGTVDYNRFLDRQEKSLELIQIILDRHGKGEIVNFLAELARIEPRIQELQPRVRDHVVHAINTFLLGVYILKKVRFPEIVNTRFNYKFMWKLCGPTHDLGYPLEISDNVANPFTSKVNEILGRIGSPSPRIIPDIYPINLDTLCNGLNANDLIQERIVEWDLDVDIENYYTWLRLQNRVDHGVISALAQLKIIDALYQRHNQHREEREIIFNGLNYNQRNFIYDIVSASSALFIHNIDLEYPGFTTKIRFETAPLAFLLFLCDTFQEWDRYSQNRTIHSGNDFNITCERNRISLFVPNELADRVLSTLNRRLIGLTIFVNDRIAVT